MTASPRETPNADKQVPANQKSPAPHTIDRTAPAGSKNSLGEESVRDGRPATRDDVVEAIDEEGPEPH